MAVMVELLNEQESLLQMEAQDDEHLNVMLEKLGKPRKVHTINDQFCEGSVCYFMFAVAPEIRELLDLVDSKRKRIFKGESKKRPSLELEDVRRVLLGKNSERIDSEKDRERRDEKEKKERKDKKDKDKDKEKTE